MDIGIDLWTSGYDPQHLAPRFAVAERDETSAKQGPFGCILLSTIISLLLLLRLR